MGSINNGFLLLFLIVISAKSIYAEEESCYGAGSIATSVIISVILTLLIVGVVFIWWKRRKVTNHLILETDPEKGKGEYAFDNPGFRDPGLTPTGKVLEKTTPKLENKKWNHWPSAFSGLTMKSEKKRTLDDSALEGKEIKVVALRSHDFTGLGFNICGNMKDGIYIKDVLHRGPASESGKLNTGDRINSVTISFEHMVYEDALTILSYASPYEVIIEAKGGKFICGSSSKSGHPTHPIYKSSSSTDLLQIEKSAKRKLYDDGLVKNSLTNLHKSFTQLPTVEKKETPSPRTSQNNKQSNTFNSEQLKNQLEKRILTDHENQLRNQPEKIEAETQKTDNSKYQKFGVKVLPFEQQKSPKIAEQNDNNTNIEKSNGIDEVNKIVQPPQAKKREKKCEEQLLNRENELNSSGIKRDINGIPQEIPAHMLNAAEVAKRNRKSSDQTTTPEDEAKSPKKSKGKAPAPPGSMEQIDKLDEIEIDVQVPKTFTQEENLQINKENEIISIKSNDYVSDSDEETDNQSSVNTIELNSSDITIHLGENEEKQNRKTASTGDLSRFKKCRETSSGTLERAQSLDITDTGSGISTLKRKAGRIEDTFDMQSDEDIFGKAMISKEPRLSLILDGLNTFQRNRLKKSTEWGNLEDAILRSNQDNSSLSDDTASETVEFNFDDKNPTLNAVVNKINEIKKESANLDIIKAVEGDIQEVPDDIPKNKIWPSDKEKIVEIEVVPIIKPKPKSPPPPRFIPKPNNNMSDIQNEIWPKELNSAKYAEDTPPHKIINTNIQQVDTEDEKNSYLNNSLSLENTALNNTDEIKPSAISETKTLESTAEDIQILDEAKHKRQQIPNNSAPQNLPPESTLEEEIFDHIKKNNKVVVPDEPEDLLEDTQPPMELLVNVPDYGNHPETGEICTSYCIEREKQHKNNIQETESFIFSEKNNACPNSIPYINQSISDDIKVSMHSLGNSEKAQSDDAKSFESLKQKSNISNVTINNIQNENGSSSFHSLEFSVNEPHGDINLSDNNELYTTAISKSIKMERDPTAITISTPDLIKNVTITEAINTLNNEMSELDNKYSALNEKRTFKVNTSLSNGNALNILDNSSSNYRNEIESSETPVSKNHSSLTYITEIHVTPNNVSNNVSEIEIVPSFKTDVKQNTNLDNDFENYIKKFEGMNEKNNDLEKKKKETIIPIEENIKAEKEMHKIQEIVQEQLKKLPEMKFTTSSYESPSRIPEKRHSQIELLRSNFEKSPPKSAKPEVAPKSRIPIATTMKTPPMSPERRDSRNMEMDNEKEILELMSSSIHSTPMSSLKYQKPLNKNVTVTSIKNNSKIPSGLPVLASSRPPVAPRKVDYENDSQVQVSQNHNISSFKQWVFDPVESVTNISVTSGKTDQK